MSRRATMLCMVLPAAVLFSTGCSATSAAFTAGKVALNLAEEGSRLTVWLDGQEGKQDTLKKAWKGPKGTRYVIKEPVSTSPTFRYAMEEPESFGRIAGVTLQIHQEFEGDFSHLAEYVVHGHDNTSESQLRPNTDYNLGSLQSNFRIADHRGSPVDRIALQPGRQYRLVLTVTADRSETILVEFETR